MRAQLNYARRRGNSAAWFSFIDRSVARLVEVADVAAMLRSVQPPPMSHPSHCVLTVRTTSFVVADMRGQVDFVGSSYLCAAVGVGGVCSATHAGGMVVSCWFSQTERGHGGSCDVLGQLSLEADLRC